MAAIAKREVGVPRTGAEELILTVRRVSQPSVRDVLLVGLTFSSGAVDAITFLALGKVFTAFMTGNLVFFGLGLAGAEVADVLRVAVSLAAFAAGVAVAARIVRASRGSRIWPGRDDALLHLRRQAQARYRGTTRDDAAIAVVRAPVELEPMEYFMVWQDAADVSSE